MEIAKAKGNNKYILSQLEEEKTCLVNIKGFNDEAKSKLMSFKSEKMTLENYIT